MNALVLINKPAGMRSTACVGAVRRKFDGLKTGHSGTLDSTASGLLVLLIGNATRFSEYIMSLPKVYRAKIQFGADTDTYDYSGEIVSEHNIENLDAKILDDTLYKFSGCRLQAPPAISAIKIEGSPAYKLARSGHDVKPEERPVFFRRVKRLTGIVDGSVELEITCGRGTYIRSLAHDLGKMLGCGAYVKALERVSVGKFTLENANNPDDAEYEMITLSELAVNYNRIYLSQRDEKSFMNGMSILIRQAERVLRGNSGLKDVICVEGDKFLGFGSYAGYDYIKPDVIVPKE